MPIYEFKCPSCGQVRETLVQGFFCPPPPPCPDCGREMERCLSTPAGVTVKTGINKTCCGREERCEKPPCSGGGHCRRH